MSLLCSKCGCTLGTLDQFCGACNVDLEEKAKAAMAFAVRSIAKPCPECYYGVPPTAVATTGVPLAIASNTTLGRPSL